MELRALLPQPGQTNQATFQNVQISRQIQIDSPSTNKHGPSLTSLKTPVSYQLIQTLYNHNNCFLPNFKSQNKLVNKEQRQILNKTADLIQPRKDAHDIYSVTKKINKQSFKKQQLKEIIKQYRREGTTKMDSQAQRFRNDSQKKAKSGEATVEGSRVGYIRELNVNQDSSIGREGGQGASVNQINNNSFSEYNQSIFQNSFQQYQSSGLRNQQPNFPNNLKVFSSIKIGNGLKEPAQDLNGTSRFNHEELKDSPVQTFEGKGSPLMIGEGQLPYALSFIREGSSSPRQQVYRKTSGKAGSAIDTNDDGRSALRNDQENTTTFVGGQSVASSLKKMSRSSLNRSKSPAASKFGQSPKINRTNIYQQVTQSPSIRVKTKTETFLAQNSLLIISQQNTKDRNITTNSPLKVQESESSK